MTFVLLMALREVRASWRRLLFFFVCVAIGVAAIIVIRSVIQSVRSSLTREAREIVGADIVVQSPRPLADEVIALKDGAVVDRRDNPSARVGGLGAPPPVHE